MSLPYVILTVVNIKSSSGYDVTKEFTGFLGQAWNASHQQVYREMGKLEEKGFLDCVHIPQEGKPDRKEYSITKAGKNELEEWLASPIGLEVVRDVFSSRILACAESSSLEFVAVFEAALEAAVKRYGESSKWLNALDQKKQLTRREQCERLVVLKNVMHYEAWIEWAKQALKVLKGL